MSKKKVLVLLSDGIGLKNFAYSKFHEASIKNDFEITFWNATSFKLNAYGFKEIPLPLPKTHRLTDIFKTARKHIELNLFQKRFSDPVFETYKFPFKFNSLNKIIKSLICKGLIYFNNSESGLLKIRAKINAFERQTDYYKNCIDGLKKENPSIVFSTNQRPLIAIAPILAAKDLKIPTATFIFSWDNLPKATMVIETDYYFVWSDYMKKELLLYYPYIKENQIFITGTPQFEKHLEDLEVTKADFFKAYNLDVSKKYICYSGDDITTSPDDASYLEDVAKAIKKLNAKGMDLGLVFRRCPVDFSNRYDAVLEKYKDIIVSIDPKWKKVDTSWNTIFPTIEDMDLLKQTSAYTELVINLGSTMVFDYAAREKPCAYINYDVKHKKVKDWSVKKIYNYMHFKSMPNKDVVIWLDNPKTITEKIELLLTKNKKNVEAAQDWFKIINLHPINNASNNIVESIKEIIQ